MQGSPRANGRSAYLAQALAREFREDFPADEVDVLSLASLDIHPCLGCEACKRAVLASGAPAGLVFPMAASFLSDDSAAATIKAARLRQVLSACPFSDGMTQVFQAFIEADELHVVSPVYFSGPPAQLKALIDRLQPCYWNLWRSLPKCPAFLYAVGEGGDPHGFAPLAGIVRSALPLAGFQLQAVYDWVGKIDLQKPLEPKVLKRKAYPWKS